MTTLSHNSKSETSVATQVMQAPNAARANGSKSRVRRLMEPASGGQSRSEANVISSSSATRRPQSAMGDVQSSRQQQQQHHEQDPVHRYSHSSRSRVTRVRINSTSEQIEDPNWLQDWQQQEAEGRQRKRLIHLKSIHRKLKSTLIAGSSPMPLSLLSLGSNNLGSSSRQSSPQASVAPPPSPIAVGQVKQPVSILKQRSNSSLSSSQTATSSGKKLNAPSDTSSSRSNRSSVKLARRAPPISPTPSVSLVTGQSQVRGSKQAEPTLSKRPASVVPICADGEVKVSGWKRNNLLAKTLSHFDEIRGNQRPIFVPTKIKLAASSKDASGETSDKASKFAEIVREAISKKNLLAEQEGLEGPRSQSASDGATRSPVAKSEEPPRAMSAASSQQQQVQVSTVIPASPLAGLMSARQLKLDQKNNQLLQSLRRQSNHETQSGLVEAPTGVPRSQSRNWRRLTQKLTLLKSSSGKGARLDGPSLVDSSGRSAGNLLAPSESESAARRLSSSSMQNPKTSKLSVVTDEVASSPTVRRSSDSDAYRRRCSGQLRVARESSQLRERDESQVGGALTVNRDDLIQLLRVAVPQDSQSSSVSEEPIESRPTADRWLAAQLAKLRRTDEQSETEVEQPELEAQVELQVETLKDAQMGLDSERDSQRRRSSSLDKLAIETIRDGSVDQDSVQLCGATSRAKIGSWMVRKSARMASLQQRLRNIRNWPNSKGKQNQRSSGESQSQSQQLNSECSEQPLGNLMAHGEEEAQNADSDKDSQFQQPLMDPTLIGDAIELFLRAMQTTSPQSQMGSDEDEDGSNTSDTRRLCSGGQNPSGNETGQGRSQSAKSKPSVPEAR